MKKIKACAIYSSVDKQEIDQIYAYFENVDSDILIDYVPIEENVSERYFGFLHFLEDKFGKKVDLLKPRSIRNPYLKRSIERDKIKIYG